VDKTITDASWSVHRKSYCRLLRTFSSSTDHKEIRESVKRFLRRNGMRAGTARDAHDAEAKNLPSQYDLMVLDVHDDPAKGPFPCAGLSAGARVGQSFIWTSAGDEHGPDRPGSRSEAMTILPRPFNPLRNCWRVSKAVLGVRTRRKALAERVRGKKRLRLPPRWLAFRCRTLVTYPGNETPLTSADSSARSRPYCERAPRVVLSREQLLDLTAGRSFRAGLVRTSDNQISASGAKIESRTFFSKDSLLQTSETAAVACFGGREVLGGVGPVRAGLRVNIVLLVVAAACRRTRSRRLCCLSDERASRVRARSASKPQAGAANVARLT